MLFLTNTPSFLPTPFAQQGSTPSPLRRLEGRGKVESGWPTWQLAWPGLAGSPAIPAQRAQPASPAQPAQPRRELASPTARPPSTGKWGAVKCGAKTPWVAIDITRPLKAYPDPQQECNAGPPGHPQEYPVTYLLGYLGVLLEIPWYM